MVLERDGRGRAGGTQEPGRRQRCGPGGCPGKGRDPDDLDSCGRWSKARPTLKNCVCVGGRGGGGIPTWAKTRRREGRKHAEVITADHFPDCRKREVGGPRWEVEEPTGVT